MSEEFKIEIVNPEKYFDNIYKINNKRLTKIK
jgi:hypothetical protein